jgi:hypothetical protein
MGRFGPGSALLNWLLPSVTVSDGLFGWNEQVFGLGHTTKGGKIGGYTMQLGRAQVTDGAWSTTTGVSMGSHVPVIGGMLDSIYAALTGPLLGWTGWNGAHGLYFTRATLAGGAVDLVTQGGYTSLYVAKGFKYTAVNTFAGGALLEMLPAWSTGLAHASPFTSATFPIKVRAFLNSASEISTGADEVLDGQATFELVYI